MINPLTVISSIAGTVYLFSFMSIIGSPNYNFEFSKKMHSHSSKLYSYSNYTKSNFEGNNAPNSDINNLERILKLEKSLNLSRLEK